MKLWKLSAINRDNSRYFGWDTHQGFVVRAESEQRAREIAAEYAEGDYYNLPTPWTNPKKTLCVELSFDGDEEVILYDYNAG